MIPLGSFLAIAAILFSIGLYGVLTKRNAVIVLLSIELMMNAVNINLIAFARYGAFAALTGQVFTLFTLTVAAAEAAVGVAILIALFRNRNVVEVDEMDLMKK